MRFEFATASRIVFGQGTLKEAVPAVNVLGKRALVVTGKSGKHADILIDQLRAEGIVVTVFGVSGEPTVDLALTGIELAKSNSVEVIIGIGGGSVLDAGKTIAALLANPGNLVDYLEVIGEGKGLSNPSLPFIAIPTTAGTGSEVTRNAVLGVPERRVKVSLRSPWMLPRLAIVDPELTYELPPGITASSGMDALTQLIEPFLSNASNPITDAICREGLRRVSRSLRQAYQHGEDVRAREDMSIASLFGGLALANARLGAVHGFAGPIGGMFPAPHGALCARLLPIIMETNLKALRSRSPSDGIFDRFEETAKILIGNANAKAEELIPWLAELCSEFKIPSLESYGVTASDFQAIATSARKSNSMKGNPIELTGDELIRILEMAV